MIKREACPQCGSRHYKRNGRIHTGKQNHKCKACGRAFVLVPENHVITAEQRALSERLLLERISLRGICRAIGVGLRWLLYFMTERFSAAPEHLYVQSTASAQRVILHRLEAEVDELWSFVGKKANRQWVWIAMDAVTRQIIAFHIGDRSRQSAQALWRKLPTGIKSTPLSTRIVTKSIRVSFPQPNTAPSPSWPVRPITLNVSTAPCDSGFRGWCGPRYRSRRNWPIISVPSSTSFVTTTSPDMQPYQDSTTKYCASCDRFLAWRQGREEPRSSVESRRSRKSRSGIFGQESVDILTQE